MTQPFRIVALVSGGGTTLQNLIDRQAAGRLAGQLVGVVSSRADALGVERARRAGLPVTVVDRPSRKRERRDGIEPNPVAHASGSDGSFADRVWAAVRAFSPDLVCFAGWLHLLPIAADF